MDVLRAYAALLVLVYHVIAVGEYARFPSHRPFGSFHIGFIGVDLFLVISGFVITASALRDYEQDPAGYRRRFFVRRLARIVPLYYLTCAVYLFIGNTHALTAPPYALARNVVLHALFLHNLRPMTHGALNGVTWTIGLEMQFYVLIALITPWLARAKPLRTLIALVCISVAWRYGVTQLPLTGEHHEHERFIYATQLPGTLDAFGMGIALALALKNGGPSVKRLLAPSPTGAAALAVLAYGAMEATMWLFDTYAGDYWGNVLVATFWRTALALTFGLALAAAITLPARVAEAKALRPLRYLGDISYGVYLWHAMILAALVRLPEMRESRLLVTTLVGSFVVSALGYHLLEKPMIERGRAFLARTTRAAEGATERGLQEPRR